MSSEDIFQLFGTVNFVILDDMKDGGKTMVTKLQVPIEAMGPPSG